VGIIKLTEVIRKTTRKLYVLIRFLENDIITPVVMIINYREVYTFAIERSTTMSWIAD